MVCSWEVIETADAPGDGVIKVRTLVFVVDAVDSVVVFEEANAVSLSRRKSCPSRSAGLPCWR